MATGEDSVFTADTNDTLLKLAGNMSNGTGNDSCGSYSPYSSTAMLLSEYRSVHGYVASLLCVIGILGNLANIVVLSRPKMATSPVNYLLMINAVANLLLMIVYLPMAVYFYIIAHIPYKEQLFVFDEGSAQFLYFATSFVVVCHSVAIWHTIAVATFRWLTVGFPNGKSYITPRVARICSVVLIVCNILLSIPNWITVEVVEFKHSGCHFHNVTFWSVGAKKDIKFNNWLFACFGKILPSVLLTMLTIPLVYIMMKAERRRQQLVTRGKHEESRRHQEHNRTTGMLLAVVILFLLIELPHGVYIIVMKDNTELENLYNLMGELIDTITIVVFSINIVLYTAMSRQFRTTFILTFCKKLSHDRGTTFRRISTMLTSIKQVSVHKHSALSNSSNGNRHHKVSDKTLVNDNYLHPCSSPLLTEDGTGTTTLSDSQSANGAV